MQQNSYNSRRRGPRDGSGSGSYRTSQGRGGRGGRGWGRDNCSGTNPWYNNGEWRGNHREQRFHQQNRQQERQQQHNNHQQQHFYQQQEPPQGHHYHQEECHMHHSTINNPNNTQWQCQQQHHQQHPQQTNHEGTPRTYDQLVELARGKTQAEKRRLFPTLPETEQLNILQGVSNQFALKRWGCPLPYPLLNILDNPFEFTREMKESAANYAVVEMKKNEVGDDDEDDDDSDDDPDALEYHLIMQNQTKDTSDGKENFIRALPYNLAFDIGF